MSDLTWFEEEFKMVEAFSCEVTPLIMQIEAYDTLLAKLSLEKEGLEKEILHTYTIESQLRIVEHTIKTLEALRKDTLTKLINIKQQYMADEIIDTLETLTSAEEGLQVSDDACELMKKITNLQR